LGTNDTKDFVSRNQHFRRLLKAELIGTNWEVVQNVDNTLINDVWYRDEIWKIESRAQKYGLSVFVAFTTDASYLDKINIQGVKAFEVFPDSLISQRWIAEAWFSKGVITQSIASFAFDLNEYRNNGTGIF